ncbi:MAG: glycosyltransferase family 1 protein [Candidatus Lernaella stagnicola]|nr:glycosyltransferase family 1 protein [Candidatus Lernaella stagnicola]
MQILFDATPFVAARPTGAGRLVQLGMAQQFELDRENLYRIFGFAPEVWPPDSMPENFRYERISPWPWLGPLAMETARRHHIGSCLTKYNIDVLHCTLEMTPVYDEHARTLFSLYDLARRTTSFVRSSGRSARSWGRTWLRYRLARKADMIHTISEFSAEQIASQLQIPQRRVRVVYPGVDPRFTPGEPDHDWLAEIGLEKEPFFLFVGQFGRQKNEEGLLRAFAAAVHENAAGNARLVLVGDDSAMRDTTRQMLRDKLPDRAILLPKATDEQLLSLYRGCVALILPSFHEGFGLPVVEAMACGSTAIVSNAGSLPEVVGDAGLVVPVDHSDDLATAIDRLVRDTELRDALRRRATVRAQHFTFAGYARGLLSLYEELAHG